MTQDDMRKALFTDEDDNDGFREGENEKKELTRADRAKEVT